MRHKPIGRAFGFHFLGRFAKSQRFGLGKNVGHKHIVMAPERIEGLTKAMKSQGSAVSLDESADRRNAGRWCPVRPIDRARLGSRLGSVQRDMFAVALHVNCCR